MSAEGHDVQPVDLRVDLAGSPMMPEVIDLDGHASLASVSFGPGGHVAITPAWVAPPQLAVLTDGEAPSAVEVLTDQDAWDMLSNCYSSTSSVPPFRDWFKVVAQLSDSRHTVLSSTGLQVSSFFFWDRVRDVRVSDVG